MTVILAGCGLGWMKSGRLADFRPEKHTDENSGFFGAI
jgi:hypothetical protein